MKHHPHGSIRPAIAFSLLAIAVLAAGCGNKPSDGGNDQTSGATQIDHVDAQGAAALLNGPSKPVVLDVRTPEEFAEGHIEGAKMIDFRASDFESKVAELDRDQSYLVHCRSGGRSTESLEIFKKLGFKHIVHLDDGFGGWEAAGQPVAK